MGVDNMIIETLALYDYRNYHHLNFKFSNKLNIIIGNNGEGKTNILEIKEWKT